MPAALDIRHACELWVDERIQVIGFVTVCPVPIRPPALALIEYAYLVFCIPYLGGNILLAPRRAMAPSCRYRLMLTKQTMASMSAEVQVVMS